MPRLTTPVRQQAAGDQRCIAYAVAAAMETSICRDRGTATGVPEMSVDDLFDSGGREVGAIDGIKFAVENGGVVDAACCPPGGQRCANPVPHIWKGRLRVIGGKQNKRVELIRTELRTSGPLVTMIQVFSNFASFTGAGIYQANTTKAGFHAVCIIGDEVDPGGASGSWIVKNSMGTGWGDGGFGRIRWHDPDVLPEKLVVVVENVHQ